MTTVTTEQVQKDYQGVLSGRLAVPEGWKEIARGEIERDFYGAE